MENTPLHTQKIEILDRLIKANQLTLAEALLLLKEEEPVQFQPVIPPATTPWTYSSFGSGGTFIGGTVTIPCSGTLSNITTTTTTSLIN